MSALNVFARFDPADGLFDTTVTTNCDNCQKVLRVAGPGSQGTEITRLTYRRSDGETHACERVFCSKECSRAFVIR